MVLCLSVIKFTVWADDIFPESLPVGSEQAVVDGLLPQVKVIVPILFGIDITGNPPPEDPVEYRAWLGELIRYWGNWTQIIGWSGEQITEINDPLEINETAQYLLNWLGDQALSIGTDHTLFLSWLDFEDADETLLVGVQNYYIPQTLNGSLTLPSSATELNILPNPVVNISLPDSINKAVLEFDFFGRKIVSTSTKPDYTSDYNIQFKNGHLGVTEDKAIGGFGLLTLFATNGASATYSMVNGARLLPLSVSLKKPDFTAESIEGPTNGVTKVTIAGSAHPVVLECSLDLKTWQELKRIPNDYGESYYYDENTNNMCFYRVRYDYR